MTYLGVGPAMRGGTGSRGHMAGVQITIADVAIFLLSLRPIRPSEVSYWSTVV